MPAPNDLVSYLIDRMDRSEDATIKWRSDLDHKHEVWHQQNLGNFDDLRDQLQGIREARAAGMVEFNEMKAWRAVKADPTLDRFIATENEVKGGMKVSRVAGYGVTAAVSAGGVAWGPKLIAMLAALLHG